MMLFIFSQVQSKSVTKLLIISRMSSCKRKIILSAFNTLNIL